MSGRPGPGRAAVGQGGMGQPTWAHLVALVKKDMPGGVSVGWHGRDGAALRVRKLRASSTHLLVGGVAAQAGVALG